MIRLVVPAAMLALAGATRADGCPVTRSPVGIYGNEFLQAGVPPDGKLVFRPGGAGFVDRDGALGIKFAWNRLVPDQLQVGGRRLDGDTAPARAYLTDYGDESFQPTYLVFPTPGCWEIAGGVGNTRLTFVVQVERIGEGPEWRFEGIQAGWRITDSPIEAP